MIWYWLFGQRYNICRYHKIRHNTILIWFRGLQLTWDDTTYYNQLQKKLPAFSFLFVAIKEKKPTHKLTCSILQFFSRCWLHCIHHRHQLCPEKNAQKKKHSLWHWGFLHLTTLYKHTLSCQFVIRHTQNNPAINPYYSNHLSCLL